MVVFRALRTLLGDSKMSDASGSAPAPLHGGADRLRGGRDTDDLNGELGADSLTGGAGVDVCDGGDSDPAQDTTDTNSCEFIRNVP